MGRITIRDLYIGQTSLDGVDGFGDVVDELYRDVGLATNKVAVHMGGHASDIVVIPNKVAVHVGRHASDIVVILGKNILDHVVLGSGGNHELKERVTRVFQLMILGEEPVGKVGEGAIRLEYVLKGSKEGIAIKCEISNDGLFAIELAFVVGTASIKLVDHFGTVVHMGMSGSPNGTVTRGCALIGLIWSCQP